MQNVKNNKCDASGFNLPWPPVNSQTHKSASRSR